MIFDLVLNVLSIDYLKKIIARTGFFQNPAALCYVSQRHFKSLTFVPS